MTEPSQASIAAWIALVRAHKRAMERVEGALKLAALPPLEWYDVLLELERGGAMRPKDLRGKLLLAQYSLSRLLARMADAGLVVKEEYSDDRRGQIVRITDTGRKLRRRMWPIYSDALWSTLEVNLDGEEAIALARLLGKIGGAGPEGADANPRSFGVADDGEQIDDQK